MSDRELIEKAARAAGIDDAEWQDMEGWGEVRHGFSNAIWSSALNDAYGTGYWNPLVDDGDEARLEAAVNIDIEWQSIGVIASINGGARFREPYSDHGGDKQKARRYAGVRAAAAIGSAHD